MPKDLSSGGTPPSTPTRTAPQDQGPPNNIRARRDARHAAARAAVSGPNPELVAKFHRAAEMLAAMPNPPDLPDTLGGLGAPLLVQAPRVLTAPANNNDDAATERSSNSATPPSSPRSTPRG